MTEYKFNVRWTRWILIVVFSPASLPVYLLGVLTPVATLARCVADLLSWFNLAVRFLPFVVINDRHRAVLNAATKAFAEANLNLMNKP